MNLTEQDIELVDAYLANELNGANLSAFKERLSQDKDFADEVMLMKALQSTVKKSVLEDKMKMLEAFEGGLNINSAVDGKELMIDGEIVDGRQSRVDGFDSDGSIHDESKTIDHGLRTMDQKSNVRMLYKVVAVAASLLVFGVVGNWWMGEIADQKALESQYANVEIPTEPPITLMMSNETSDHDPKMIKASNLYNLAIHEKDQEKKQELFKQAAPLFKEVWDQEKNQDALKFAGWSWLGAKEYRQYEKLNQLVIE